MSYPQFEPDNCPCNRCQQSFSESFLGPCDGCAELFTYRPDVVPRKPGGGPVCGICYGKVMRVAWELGYPFTIPHPTAYLRLMANY